MQYDFLRLLQQVVVTQMAKKPDATAKMTWPEALNAYCQRPVIRMLFLGFSAGLPYLLVFSTLTAWLRDEGLSRSAIGFFGWVGITFSIKVLWAPVIDRLPLPILSAYLGRRRAWLLVAQIGIVAALVFMSGVRPVDGLGQVALCALLVAFFSATQDIVIDAYRIESGSLEIQGAMASTYNLGYRCALLVAGAGALFIADIASWPIAYLSMAVLMSLGILTTLLIAEPRSTGVSDILEPLFSRAWFYQAVVAPFVDFFQRNGKFALVLLLFIGLFRLSDITMGIMANPFYLDLGFSKTEIAGITKVFGFTMTVLGAFLGGLGVLRWGLYRPLVIAACAVALTNLLFAQLALVGANTSWLVVTISADNISQGFASAAFIAYLSSLTNRAYTATQYALFSSLMNLPGKFLSGFSGVIVDASGYAIFFVYAALMGLPAIGLALYICSKRDAGTDEVS